MQDRNSVRGALAGWKRHSAGDGVIVELQVARTVSDFEHHNYEVVALALNSRQLRSFARDMVRASEGRGIDLFARRRSLWDRLLGRRR